MGADGGIKLYRLSDIKSPKVWDRIMKWFIFEIFEGGDTLSEWNRVPIDPSNPWRTKAVETVLTRQEWFEREGIKDEKSLNLEYLSYYYRPSISIWRKDDWPITEDLVRISYGDNVSESINDLISIIDGELYYLNKDYGIDPNEEVYSAPESWSEETWT